MGNFERFRPYLTIAAAFVVGAAVGYLIAYLSGAKPGWMPLFSAILGLLVAFAIPTWQVFFLNAPKLAVEISAISRPVSESATIVLNEHSELAILRPSPDKTMPLPFYMYDEDTFYGRAPTPALKIDAVENLLSRAKQHVKELPSHIDDRSKQLANAEARGATAATKFDYDLVAKGANFETEFDQPNYSAIRQSLIDHCKKHLEAVKKRLAELQSNLSSAERKLEILKASLLDNRSFLVVTASLINSGRTNTAIKVPALLRVSIGEGNYIDIKMSLKDFEKKSEISANGTRIVVFESSEISSFPEDDRRLIKTYWGQSVSACLYIEDIHARPFASNKIAFAEGLYQKMIYDRLAQFASPAT